MKRLLSLTIVLLFAFICSASLAEASMTASDGTPIQMKDFTLALESGMYYQPPAETDPQLIVVYPGFASADMSIVAVMYDEANTLNATEESLAEVAESIRKEGLRGAQCTVTGPDTAEMFHKNCYVTTIRSEEIILGSVVITYSRTYQDPESGYNAIITTDTEERLDAWSEWLNSAFSWNEAR